MTLTGRNGAGLPGVALRTPALSSRPFHRHRVDFETPARLAIVSTSNPLASHSATIRVIRFCRSIPLIGHLWIQGGRPVSDIQDGVRQTLTERKEPI